MIGIFLVFSAAVAAVVGGGCVFLIKKRIFHTGNPSIPPIPGKKRRALRKRREAIFDEIENGEADCSICLEKMQYPDEAVFCVVCAHVLHLHCFNKYKKSRSGIFSRFRGTCPTCNRLTLVTDMPNCMCGRPKANWNRNDEVENKSFYIPTIFFKDREPYTCGKLCSRCNIEFCHPGLCWQPNYL